MSPLPSSVQMPSGTWKRLRADFLFLAVLAATALGAGLGLNFLRARPLPLVYVSRAARLQQSVARLSVGQASPPPASTMSNVPAAAPSPGIVEGEQIDLARFHALTEDPANLILDARPPLFYQVGHVPGAHRLSRAEFEADYAALRPQLESHRQGTLAVYCAGGECEDSRMVADALRKLGYPHVVIYAGGWEEWQAAGLPEERR